MNIRWSRTVIIDLRPLEIIRVQRTFGSPELVFHDVGLGQSPDYPLVIPEGRKARLIITMEVLD